MKTKQLIRIVVDIAMTILLFALMAFIHTGQALHEVLGATQLVLFIVHLILNAKWIKNIGRGKYAPFRILQTALASLVLIAMLGACVSGMMMSGYVFAFLDVGAGMAFARSAHMICVYWGFLFLAAHLGLHWNYLVGVAKNALGIKKQSSTLAKITRVASTLFAGFGACAFWKQQIGDYLFLKKQFVFFDSEQSKILFLLEYLAIACLCAFIARYLGDAIQKTTAKKEKQ